MTRNRHELNLFLVFLDVNKQAQKPEELPEEVLGCGLCEIEQD